MFGQVTNALLEQADDNLTISAGSLTLGDDGMIVPVNSTLTLSGTGILNGNGNVTIDGSLFMAGGSVSGTGTFTTNNVTTISSTSPIAYFQLAARIILESRFIDVTEVKSVISLSKRRPLWVVSGPFDQY